MKQPRRNTLKTRRTRRRRISKGGAETAPETKEMESYIPRKDTSAPSEVNGVPLVIHRTWNTKSVPIGIWNHIHSSLTLTPEFDHYFYTDEERLKFIEENFEPDVGKAYRRLKAGAYKADLWRYCIIYVKGGVYIDADLELVKPLLPILKENPRIYIQDIPGGNGCATPYPGVCNGFLTSPPKNPVFKDCIDEIVESCRKKDYKSGILDITGPCMLSRKIAGVEGEASVTSSPFKHDLPEKFRYNGELFLKVYSLKDKEPATGANIHYSERYGMRNVFNNSVAMG